MNKPDNSNNPLWSNVFAKASDWRSEAVRLFHQTPLFETTSRRTLRHLVNEMYHRHYQDMEPVFERGDPGLGMYLVLEGRVAITVDDKLLAELSVGDFFGEIALMGDERRTASARAIGDTRLVGFFRPALQEWVERQPQMGAQFLLQLGQVLAERLRKTNERLMLAEGK